MSDNRYYPNSKPLQMITICVGNKCQENKIQSIKSQLIQIKDKTSSINADIKKLNKLLIDKNK